MRPSRADVLQLLGDLAEIYSLPKGRTVEQMARVYEDVLTDLPLEALRGAVRDYRRSDERFFPKPGALRALARRHVREEHALELGGLEARYWTWERTKGDGAPCPVCGSVVEVRDGRVNVWHDHQRHHEAAIGYVGPRTGPADDRGRMKPATWQVAA